jgi:hypothetical protein
MHYFMIDTYIHIHIYIYIYKVSLLKTLEEGPVPGADC